MFDRVISLFLFILFIPAMLVIVAVSLVVFGKGVFFLSDRYGKEKKIFRILKFRTMRNWSDTEFESYLSDHPDQQREWRNTRKLEHDPRCTAWGYFLRKYSLDELPQFLNVIAGQMALVGPRPIDPEEERFFGKYGAKIHSVKPGITGLWQVSGRNLISYHRRIAANLYYIRHKSVRLDAWILFRTIDAVFTCRGSF